jgi:hypothetical protein
VDAMTVSANVLFRDMIEHHGLSAVIEKLAGVAVEMHPDDDSWRDAAAALRLVAEEAVGTSVV